MNERQRSQAQGKVAVAPRAAGQLALACSLVWASASVISDWTVAKQRPQLGLHPRHR